MFKRDRIGKGGGGVIIYIYIQNGKANCDEAVWYNIITGNSTLRIGLVYRSPNINEEDNRK